MQDNVKKLGDMTVNELAQCMTADGLQHFEMELKNTFGSKDAYLEIRFWDISIYRYHHLTLDSPMPDQKARITSLDEKASYLQRELTSTLGRIVQLREEQAADKKNSSSSGAKAA